MTTKEFVMKHVVNQFGILKANTVHCGETEEHFNVPWRVQLYRKKGKLSFFLQCLKPYTGSWSIEAELEFKLISPFGRHLIIKSDFCFGKSSQNTWGYPYFTEYETVQKEYSNQGKLETEVFVKIKEITGIERIGKNKLMNFDESIKEFSDIVLVVEGEKFYLSKMFLALHSSYFKSLLLGNFEESGKNVVTINNIDPDDFQCFLEVLHGESAINENTVERILLLADMYDAKSVIRKSEEFLVEKSKKSFAKKLELSMRFHLDNLKNHCLNNIKTVNDIRSLVPSNLCELDRDVLETLFQKILSFV